MLREYISGRGRLWTFLPARRHGNVLNPELIEDGCYVNINILDYREKQIDYQECIAINADDNNLVRNIRFENLNINGKVISDNMPERPKWYKTSDLARIFVGEHVEDVTFAK